MTKREATQAACCGASVGNILDVETSSLESESLAFPAIETSTPFVRGTLTSVASLLARGSELNARNRSCGARSIATANGASNAGSIGAPVVVVRTTKFEDTTPPLSITSCRCAKSSAARE